MSWPPRAKPAALALLVTAALVVAARLAITNAELDVWTPAVVVGLVTVAVTVTLVEGILRRELTERIRDRVVQGLRHVSGTLHVLADFVLWDYVDMHSGESYVRPPAELRALLAHWKAGLATKEGEWPASPRILTASQGIARVLEEELHRHERVLEDDFVAAGYRFIEGDLMSRNMYLDTRPHTTRTRGKPPRSAASPMRSRGSLTSSSRTRAATSERTGSWCLARTSSTMRCSSTGPMTGSATPPSERGRIQTARLREPARSASTARFPLISYRFVVPVDACAAPRRRSPARRASRLPRRVDTARIAPVGRTG